MSSMVSLKRIYYNKKVHIHALYGLFSEPFGSKGSHTQDVLHYQKLITNDKIF